jgi:hypothetical protein
MRQRAAQHLRTLGANHNGRAADARSSRAQFAVACLVVAALEVDPAIAQQSVDDGERFGEALEAVVERKPEIDVLDLIPTRAQADNQPAIGNLVDGVGHLGEEGRVAK